MKHTIDTYCNCLGHAYQFLNDLLKELIYVIDPDGWWIRSVTTNLLSSYPHLNKRKKKQQNTGNYVYTNITAVTTPPSSRCLAYQNNLRPADKGSKHLYLLSAGTWSYSSNVLHACKAALSTRTGCSEKASTQENSIFQEYSLTSQIITCRVVVVW